MVFGDKYYISLVFCCSSQYFCCAGRALYKSKLIAEIRDDQYTYTDIIDMSVVTIVISNRHYSVCFCEALVVSSHLLYWCFIKWLEVVRKPYFV